MSDISTPTKGLNPASMTPNERMMEAAQRAVPMLGPETGAKLKAMLTWQNLAAMGAIGAACAVAQLTPIGWAVDAIVLGVAAFGIGFEAGKGLLDLASFVSRSRSAQTEAELDEAANSLAKAVSTLGIDTLQAIVLHKAASAADAKITAEQVKPPPSAAAEEAVGEKVCIPCQKAAERAAGSSEHKNARWAQYLERMKGNPKQKNYETWSKMYDLNMTRAKKANAAVDAFHKKLGWGKREVTIKMGRGEVRRLDIADVNTKKGIEHKTGYITANEEILDEIRRDKLLVRRGWDLTWVFEGKPSQPLLEALDKAGIKSEIKPPN